MTEHQALKCSLALPLIASSVAALILHYVPERIWGKVPEFIVGIIGFVTLTLFGSGIFGGVPYLILCAGILWWTRKRSLNHLKITLWLSPLLMIPIFFTYWLITAAIEHGNRIGLWQSVVNEISNTERMSAFVYFCLGLGYSYVILVFVSIWFLKKRNYLLTVRAI